MTEVQCLLPREQACLSRSVRHGARLTPPLDQSTIGSDHLPVAPRVIDLHAICPRAGAGFFFLTASDRTAGSCLPSSNHLEPPPLASPSTRPPIAAPTN